MRGSIDREFVAQACPLGTAHGQARLRQGIRPDVLLMLGQFGHWKTPYAKDIKMPGLNDLVPMEMDFLDGSGSSIDATKVNIKKVEAQA